MASTARTAAPIRWGLADRIPLILLLVAFALGTPGLGPETRHFSNDTIANVLAVIFLIPPVAALALSWKYPAMAAGLGLIAGALLMVTSVLDLLGLFVGPPPASMIVVDGLILVFAAAVVWRSWLVRRG